MLRRSLLRAPSTIRTFSTSSSRTMASPFTQAVVTSMRNLYPEALADRSFDNTGLLLEAPFLPERRNRNSILLTIDLTKAVAEEAIENKHSIVIAYHPIIFRGLKALTLGDSQQNTLLRLAAHGISVYSPHTAVDIVPGGMGDWLCDVVTGKSDSSSQASSPTSDTDRSTTTSSSSHTSQPTKPPQSSTTSTHLTRPAATHRTYSTPTYPHSTPTTSPTLPHTRTIITPSPQLSLDTANATHIPPKYHPTTTGSGRLITFTTPQPLTTLITRIATSIGSPKGFPVAIPQLSHPDTLLITTVGVCPGSGGSVISKASPPPDLIVTGEMSHHEALAVTERGGCVVGLFHSNSERGYLAGVMKEKLEREVRRVWQEKRTKMKREGGEWGDGVEEVLEDEGVEVVVSQVDRDPYGIVVLEETRAEGVSLGGVEGGVDLEDVGAGEEGKR